MSKKKKMNPGKLINPEQLHMDNERLFEFLQKQQFGSMDEINDFIKSNVIGKKKYPIPCRWVLQSRPGKRSRLLPV
jgi:hypothetical protein